MVGSSWAGEASSFLAEGATNSSGQQRKCPIRSFFAEPQAGTPELRLKGFCVLRAFPGQETQTRTLIQSLTSLATIMKHLNTLHHLTPYNLVASLQYNGTAVRFCLWQGFPALTWLPKQGNRACPPRATQHSSRPLEAQKFITRSTQQWSDSMLNMQQMPLNSTNSK